MDKKLNKNCKICGNEFITGYPKKLFCSFDCKLEANRRRTKEWRRKKVLGIGLTPESRPQ